MRFVGKIDLEIYKCVSADIITDEVVITDERIQHIMEHHPGAYEQYASYFRAILEEPDYIIEANREKTAVILKEIDENGENFKLILRLVTSTDDAAFKNSIITFMKISDKDWDRLLKNKRILYKRE